MDAPLVETCKYRTICLHTTLRLKDDDAGVVFKEQLAREKKVSGRVQIQVSYHDERKELSVAVLAADDLVCREDGALPEAFAQLRLLPAM